MCADSTASGKLRAQFAKIICRHRSRPISGLGSRSIKLNLSQVKKERQSKRNADEQGSDNWQPQKSDACFASFCLDKNEENDCRDDHVHREKRTDAIREEVMNEGFHVRGTIAP